MTALSGSVRSVSQTKSRCFVTRGVAMNRDEA